MTGADGMTGFDGGTTVGFLGAMIGALETTGTGGGTGVGFGRTVVEIFCGLFWIEGAGAIVLIPFNLTYKE